MIRFLLSISFPSSYELPSFLQRPRRCSRSEQWVGIRGIEPKWFNHICPTERSVSDWWGLRFGPPFNSIFIFGSKLRKRGVTLRSYADDTQICPVHQSNRWPWRENELLVWAVAKWNLIHLLFSVGLEIKPYICALIILWLHYTLTCALAARHSSFELMVLFRPWILSSRASASFSRATVCDSASPRRWYLRKLYF